MKKLIALYTEWIMPNYTPFISNKLWYATSLRARSFGGMRTLVEGLKTWTSHDANEKAPIAPHLHSLLPTIQ